MNIKLLSIVLAGFALVSLPVIGQDWSQFRGPNATGFSSAQGVPIEWSEDKNIRWKSAIPGRGWSSPVIAENELWFTTALEVKATGESAKEKMKSARVSGSVPYERVEFVAICVDRTSGEMKHQVSLFETDSPPLINSLNSFASPTPAVDGKNVIVSFGTFGTACLERSTAEIVWTNTENQLKHETGPGSSPIIFGDLVILHCDGIDSQSVVAMSKKTGENVWKTNRSGELHPNDSLKKSFATPTVAKLDDRDVIVSPGANWIYVYDARTGEEIFKANYGESTAFSNAPVALVAGHHAIICTGYNRSVLVCVDLLAEDDTDPIIWKFRSQVPTMSSPILVDGRVFMVSDRGIMSCVDSLTGEKVWQERLSGTFCASPILLDGNIHVSNAKGQSFVVRCSDEFELVAQNQLDSDIMATPAAHESQLYIRTRNSLYCIENQADD